MEKYILNFLKYYRNSLADGENHDISKKEAENGFQFEGMDNLDQKELSKAFNELFKTLPKQSKKEENKPNIPIFISPFFLSDTHDHGVKKKNKQKIHPFWIPGEINENGELFPPNETEAKPWFVRSVLEPTSTSNNDFPIVSSVKEVDQALNRFETDVDSWESYCANCESFFKKVTGNSYYEFVLEGYVSEYNTCLIKAKDMVPAAGVLKLYDHIIENKTDSPLLNELIGNDHLERIPSPDSFLEFLKPGHYGQYNDQFSLSTSQRKSVIAFDSQPKGSTLAVNGPPGTGKTTLLQSIVANLMVKSVIIGKRPPCMVASSTNNQAITNILDSFGTSVDVVSWMPNLTSLGTYMISGSPIKQQEALEKGYQLLLRERASIVGKYFDSFHNADLDEIENYYLSRQNILPEGSNLNKVTDALNSKVIKSVEHIDYVLDITKKTIVIEKKYFKFKELDNKKEELESIESTLVDIEEKFEVLIAFRDKLDVFLNNNKILQILSFISPFRYKLQNRVRLFLADAPIQSLRGLSLPNEIQKHLLNLLEENQDKKQAKNNELDAKRYIYNEVLAVKNEWDTVFNQLKSVWNVYLSKLNSGARKAVSTEYNNAYIPEKVNMILDISYRYEAFIYSKYYWEGKWIQLRKTDGKEPGKWMNRREEFKYMSYITPLFISTFHTLPNYCSYSKETSGEWVFHPLYDLFDLLIVDEAGQVSPEIAVPSFSLASKALVVGDVSQIEPVWNIAYRTIDEGNLNEVGLLKQLTYKDLEDKGVLCASGSLMKLAQGASHYYTNKNLNGTFLSEHRRCVDELVAFSNKHVYDNLLIPKVGSSQGQDFLNEAGGKLNLPPLSYVNISGQSASKNSSNYNSLEALAVAKWIATYKKHLLFTTNDGKPNDKHKQLKDIIAVVTPFAAQRNEIKKHFKTYKVEADITVGTVHALQGAEREIVIFSPTYGVNHNGSLFFDAGFNMLNVALTRAKKHFIVMGNMRLFNPQNTSTPSGGLASFLFAKAENELSSAFFYDSVKIVENNTRINKLNKHVEALKKSFKTAKEQLIIVSPFISKKAMDADGLEAYIKDAVARNVKIMVFTDKNLDGGNGKFKDHSKAGRELLEKHGVKLRVLDGIHNKAIAIDDKILIEGSFNWLSAVRDESSPFCRYEVSQIIMGDDASKQISQLIADLGTIPNR